jgi:CRP/FNR family transcriptional regulator, cyclic AMP receptor protein
MLGATQLMQIKRLGSFAETRRIASGTPLFLKGAPGTALFAVVSGTVKIAVVSIDGREATFNLLHAGDIFGEIAVLDGQPRTANAIAVTDCELMVIKHDDFLRFVHGEPEVSMKLIELLCARLRVAGTRMEEAVFLNLPVRLARLLVRLLEENAAAADKNNLSITQQEISGLLATTRESVNRHLRIWARRRVIALKRGSILVLAPRALAALASGDDDGNYKSGPHRSHPPPPWPAAAANGRLVIASQYRPMTLLISREIVGMLFDFAISISAGGGRSLHAHPTGAGCERHQRPRTARRPESDSMSALHLERQLNTGQRRALELLAAAGEQGCTGARLFNHEFTVGMLADLVWGGFATGHRETVRVGHRNVKVARIRITMPDGGRLRAD